MDSLAFSVVRGLGVLLRRGWGGLAVGAEICLSDELVWSSGFVSALLTLRETAVKA
jgi:hypothetical protein